jgi:signal transduction histidine kinase/DNA-binding response OmpR family regulator
MVACHHRTPTAMPVRLTRACYSLALTIGALIGASTQRQRDACTGRSAKARDQIVEALSETQLPLADAVECAGASLLEIASASGGALWYDDRVLPFGQWPDGLRGKSIIAHVFKAFHASNCESIFESSVELDPPLSADEMRTVCGIAAISLDGSASRGLVWLRPEYQQILGWGGDPNKTVTADLDAQGRTILSPRSSFARFESEIKGHSHQWSDADREAVLSLVALRQVLQARDSIELVSMSSRHFRNLVALQGDVYWQLNSDGALVVLSRPLPVGDGTIDGKSLPDLFVPDCDAAAVGSLREALASNQPFRALDICGYAGAQRAAFALLVSGEPLYNPLGDVAGWHGTITDITERALQESRLLEAKQLAESANAAKSIFVANVSHEFRTPMNAVLGMLRLMKGTELTPRQRDYRDKAEGAARALLGLLSDVLDYSKIEAQQMALDQQPFMLENLLRDLSVVLSTGAGPKDVDLLYDIDPALPPALVGDSTRLNQVLVNLGSNALKFTEHGQVVIGMHLKASRDGMAVVEFSVRDSGIGIAEENQTRIFLGFVQAETTTTRRYGGTGLGLAISKRLVEAMGGAIRLSSATGAGSTFSFTLELPVVDAPAASGAGSAAAHGTAGAAAPRVLIVDDNPVSRQLLQVMASRLGWQADVADTSEQAIVCWQVAERGAGEPGAGEPGVGEPAVGAPYAAALIDGGLARTGLAQALREAARSSARAAPPRLVLMDGPESEASTFQAGEGEGERERLFDHALARPFTARMLHDALSDRPQALAVSEPVLHRLAGLRLLLVEDNAINQEVANDLLEAEGAVVSLADNGELGVRAVLAASPPFDAVLMDVQMPVLDGYGATRAIRQHAAFATLPIIAMTAGAMASDREQCLASGMDAHTTKPLELDALVALLLQIVGQRRGGADEHTAAVAGEASVVVAQSVISIDVAGALARLAGHKSIYLRSVNRVLTVLDSIVDEYRQTLSTQGVEPAVRQMHSLKGLAGTVGATALAAEAARLETLCAAGVAPEAALAQIEGLQQIVEKTRSALQRVIEQP